jgi:signal transduction histidine kinase
VVSHSGGNLINISVSAADSAAVISVADNGRGIASDNIPYIFERLYKQDEARGVKGSGLGLSITQELVKAHGGSITVKSLPYKSTEFIIRLPFAIS